MQASVYAALTLELLDIETELVVITEIEVAEEELMVEFEDIDTDEVGLELTDGGADEEIIDEVEVTGGTELVATEDGVVDLLESAT